MTRSRDVSAVQNNLGVAIPPAAAGKNAVINGGFDIWQRGTASQTPANGQQLNFDRFYYTGGGGVVFTQDTDVPTSPYFQYSVKTVDGSNYGMSFAQKIEAANAVAFAGQTVTFSFWAKTTSGSATMYANAYYPSAKDNFASVTLIASNTMTTPNSTWTRYTTTFSLPSNVQNGLLILIGRGSTTNTSFYTGVQLELGSSATPFSRAGGSIGGELALCQRYYQRATNTGGSAYGAPAINGYCPSVNAVELIYSPPVTFRIAPTVIDYSGMAVQGGGGTVVGGFSSITIDTNVTSPYAVAIICAKTASFTATQFVRMLKNNNANDYIGFSAEL